MNASWDGHKYWFFLRLPKNAEQYPSRDEWKSLWGLEGQTCGLTLFLGREGGFKTPTLEVLRVQLIQYLSPKSGTFPSSSLRIGWWTSWKNVQQGRLQQHFGGSNSDIFLTVSALDFLNLNKAPHMSKANELWVEWRWSLKNIFINIVSRTLQVNSRS